MKSQTQKNRKIYSHFGKFTAKMSGACSWPSTACTSSNLRDVNKSASVPRIGALSNRDTDFRMGEYLEIFYEF
jgi:hypothetical protein